MKKFNNYFENALQFLPVQQ